MPLVILRENFTCNENKNPATCWVYYTYIYTLYTMYHLHYTYLIKIHIYTSIISSYSVNYHKDMKLIYMYLLLIKNKNKSFKFT